MNAVTNISTPAINVCKVVSIRLGHLDEALQCRLLYLQHSALLHCLGREDGCLQKSRLTLQGLGTFPVHSESAPQIFHGGVPSMAMTNNAVQISNAAPPSNLSMNAQNHFFQRGKCQTWQRANAISPKQPPGWMSLKTSPASVTRRISPERTRKRESFREPLAPQMISFSLMWCTF